MPGGLFDVLGVAPEDVSSTVISISFGDRKLKLKH